MSADSHIASPAVLVATLQAVLHGSAEYRVPSEQLSDRLGYVPSTTGEHWDCLKQDGFLAGTGQVQSLVAHKIDA